MRKKSILFVNIIFSYVYGARSSVGTSSGETLHPVDMAYNLLGVASSGVNAIAIICGMFFLCSGLYHYSLYRKDPINVRLSSPVVMIFLSILLFCIPYFSDVVGS